MEELEENSRSRRTRQGERIDQPAHTDLDEDRIPEEDQPLGGQQDIEHKSNTEEEHE